jgi:magnesium-transporting ATPase (P-type)
VKVFGSNERVLLKGESFWSYFLNALDDDMMKILIAAAFASMLINFLNSEIGVEEEGSEYNWVEGFGIFGAVLICTLVNSVNDYEKE